MRKLLLTTFSVVALMLGATTSHATITIVGGAAGSTTADNDVLGIVSGFFGANLSATPGQYEYIFVGKEAAFVDHFNTPGSTFNNQTAAVGDHFQEDHGGGLLKFTFVIDDISDTVVNGTNVLPGANPNFFLASYTFMGIAGFVIGLDDTGAGPDDNHDDLVVFVHAVGVPEPASLALFGAALAGLGLLRRRRSA